MTRMTPQGMTVLQSKYGPHETANRLISALSARGMTLMARVDHAAAAKDAGMELRPTEVLIFGNPKGGTPLMQAAQTSGIDLPLKALIWLDADGRTWLGYNEPAWLVERHAIAVGESVLTAMREALAAIARDAAGG